MFKLGFNVFCLLENIMGEIIQATGISGGQILKSVLSGLHVSMLSNAGILISKLHILYNFNSINASTCVRYVSVTKYTTQVQNESNQQN